MSAREPTYESGKVALWSKIKYSRLLTCPLQNGSDCQAPVGGVSSRAVVQPAVPSLLCPFACVS
jgi:hypothetical protein